MLIALAALALSSPQDWPQWRGPDRDGVARSSEWSSSGTTAWRRAVGIGLSCPSIADGRVFTLGFDPEREVDVLVCLDEETGDELWSDSYPAHLRDQDHAGGSLTTPTIAGERLYVFTREGTLRRYAAATGELDWAVDVAGEVETEPSDYGFSSSPFLFDGIVIVGVAKVVALDAESGEILWQTEPIDSQFSTPSLFHLAGQPRLAVFTEVRLEVLDPVTGAILTGTPWAPVPRGVNASTPVVVGERIFVSSAYERGCALLEFEGDETRTVWANRRMRNKMAGCVLVNDLIFGFDESMLKCLDLEGNERWRKRGLGNGAVAAAGDRLLLTSSKGELIVAEATGAEYRELSREKLFDEGTFWTMPVFANGRIYARSSLGALVCRDHRTDVATAGATASGDAAELPVAKSLFAGHLERVGGAAAVERHVGRRTTGTFEMSSVGVLATEFVAHHRAPGLWHAKIRAPGGRSGHFWRVFDGEVAWEVNPFVGDELMSENATRELADSCDPQDAAHYRENYTAMRTVGQVLFADRPCWRVDTTTRGGAQRAVYFSVETGLMVGRESETESIAVFDAWTEFDGVLYPTLEKYFVLESGIEEVWRITDVELLDPDIELFERPEEIQELVEERDSIEVGGE